MPSWFLLELDTTAPEVTLGAVVGDTAGELLRVRYVASEPLAEASLELPDGRVLAVEVLADELRVLLPVDAPDGLARLRWADDVANAAEAILPLRGVVVVPPDEPAPTPPARGMPGRARGHQVESLSVVRARSTASGAARAQATTVVRASSSRRTAERVTVHPAERKVGRSTVRVATRVNVRSDLHSTSVATAQSGAEVHRRDDEALLALLL